MTNSDDGTIHTTNRAGLLEFVSVRDGLLQVIEQIRGGGKNRLDYNVIKDMVSVLGEKAGEIYQVYELPKGLTVLRVRSFDYPTDKGKYALADLGPPPHEKLHEYGRCNRPNIPVFYTSLYEDIALSEVYAERGKYYLVAEYEVSEQTRLIPIGELDTYRRTGDTFLGNSANCAHDLYKRIIESGDMDALIIDAFFSEEFIKPIARNSDYSVTSAFSGILFGVQGKDGPPDGLLYPSVAFRGGYNFVFSVEAHQAKLKLKSARVIKVVNDLGFGIYEYKIIEKIDISGDKLVFLREE